MLALSLGLGCTTQRLTSRQLPGRTDQERDLTIDQLKAALDASRCRAAALEQALLGVSPARLGANGGGKKSHQLHDVLAQSAVHFKQYKQIRGNYNKLLARCTSACLQ